MYFYFSDKVVLLFDFWNVRTPAGMVLSVLVVLLLAMLYEAIKISKTKLLRQTILAIPTTLSQESLREPETGSINSNVGQQNTTSKRCRIDPTEAGNESLDIMGMLRASPLQRLHCSREWGSVMDTFCFGSGGIVELGPLTQKTHSKEEDGRLPTKRSPQKYTY
ncbi:probable low affinity copper uptake protein 2 isoform X2 [Mauremys reevesii]|nr:probable low affinity copper uptake protein 2 isoform X2 [Mauremys reevesii]